MVDSCTIVIVVASPLQKTNHFPKKNSQYRGRIVNKSCIYCVSNLIAKFLHETSNFLASEICEKLCQFIHNDQAIKSRKKPRKFRHDTTNNF